MKSTLPKYMTVPKAAKHFGINEPVFRRRVQSGRYPSMMIGSRTVVEVEGTAKIIEAENEAKAKPGLCIRDVSEKTGLSDSAIRRGIREGWLPFWKDGIMYQFDEQAVMNALAQRTGTKEDTL